MKHILKKSLAIILSVATILCCAPLSGIADLDLPEFGGFKKLASSVSDFFDSFAPKAEATTYKGTCGDNLTWRLDSYTSELIINGTGDMTDWLYGGPWCSNNYGWGSWVKTVVIGNGVTSIGNYAFEECKNLTSVIIPDSVTSIGESAFRSCNRLTNITIPDSVTSIGESAFYGCSSLTSITIPDGVTSLAYSTFMYSGITDIAIPNSVRSIGEMVFCGCSNLETNIVIPDGVTSIGSSLFYGCHKLTGVTIPDSVTSIGGGAFESCSSLKSITIPDSVTSIGSHAFEDCTSLTSITISNGITSISDRTFAYCYSLTSVVIPDGVTIISDYAFYKCEGLSSVFIPDSVTYMCVGSFSNCGDLTIYYEGTKNNWNKIKKQTFYSSGVFNETTLKIIYDYTVGQFDIINISKDFYTCYEGESVYVSGDLYSADGTSNITLDWTSGDGVEVMAPASIMNSDANNASFSVEVKGLSAGMHDVTVRTSSGKVASCKVTVIKPENEFIVSVSSTGEYYFVDGMFLDGKLEDVEKIPFKITVENRLKEGEISNLSDDLKEKLLLENVKIDASLSDYSCFLIDINDMSELKSIGNLQIGEKKEFVLNVYPNNFKLPEKEITLNTTASASGQSDISNSTPIKIKDKLYDPYAVVSFNVYNQNIIYNDKNYSSDSIGISVRVTNRIPSSFSGNAAKLREISACDITVSEIEISAEDSKLLSDAGIRTKELNTVLHAGESTTFEVVYNVNTRHRMDEKVESETVGFSCDVSTSANSLSLSKSVTFDNKDCKLEEIKNENIENAAKDAAKEFEKLKSGNNASVILDPNLGLYLTDEEIEQVKDAIIAQILMLSISDQSLDDRIMEKYKKYAGGAITDNLEGELKESMQFFLDSFDGISVDLYEKDIDLPLVIESEKYGTVTFTVKTRISKYGLDETEIASFEALNCTISGEKIPGGKKDLYAGTVAITKATDFLETATELVEETIAALYNEVWGNDFNKVTDLICGEAVNKFLSKTKYKNAAGVVYASAVAPTKKFLGKCPVDIFVYDAEGNLCASIEDDVVTKTSDKAEASVDGSEKYVILWDETYTVKFKPTGNDATMDIIIEEYANSSSLLRKVVFDDVPLNFGEHYTQTIASGVLEDESGYALTNEASNEKIQSDSVEKILHSHNVEEYETVSQATCSQPEIMEGECTICYETIRYITETFADCQAGEWETVTESTCTTIGEKVKKCTVCGEVLETESIPVTGHTQGSWVTSITPSCTEAGEKIAHCTSCGIVVANEVVPALGHKAGEWEVVTNSSCSSVGKKAKRCVVCDEILETEEIAMTKHIAGSWITVLEPTTTTEGKMVRKCTACGVVLEEKTIPAVEDDITVEIKTPSRTTINYGDSIILHAEVDGVMPAGYTLNWTADNGNFSYKADGATCTISPAKSGDTTFTATIYDANGNAVSTDEQTMTAKAGFFDKIIAFFKKLFGLTKTYPSIFIGISD